MLLLASPARSLLFAKRLIHTSSRSVSNDVANLVASEVKVVRHVRNIEYSEYQSLLKQALLQELFRLVETFKIQTGLGRGSAFMQQLMQLCPELVERCRCDVLEIGSVFEEALGCEQVEVKLEALKGTPCTKFHMDHVPLRAICTYLGPGTEYVPSEACYVVGGQVVEVLENEATRAATGDVIYLKGSHWRESHAPGAVHRSPYIDPEDLRLVLTVDACC